MGEAKLATAGRCGARKRTVCPHARRNQVHTDVRELDLGYEAGVKTATSAVGGAILGASIGGGVVGALIGGAVGLAAPYAARSLDKQGAKKRNG